MPKIKFIAPDEETYEKVPMPEPASKFVPNWYKKSNKFKESNSISFDENNFPEKTIKACIPVLDSINAGYIQKSWTDIYIECDKENVSYRWATGPKNIGIREDWRKQNMPVPAGHYPHMFVWTRPWAIKTPIGYSTLLIHPNYHTELPFTCFPGIIDTDNYNNPGYSSVPFFIKEGFSGIIPAGTPMYQMIPYKKESWSSEKLFKDSIDIVNRSKNLIESKFVDGYKKLFWNKVYYK